MKRILFILLSLVAFVQHSFAQEHRRYALVWHDEFDSDVLDNKVWKKIWRNQADWGIHMSSHPALYGFEDGDLVLRGMVNDFLPDDTAHFLTGGVWSRNRKTFGFGRLEIRAKFDVAQGFWPAIWMLPQANQALNWPHGGEIDIMEHFRSNPTVNQTVHSHYTVNLRKRNVPSHVAYPKYNEGEYNTYGLERFQDSLVFFVNGRRTLNYPRYRKGENGQFPFGQHDYYLILDAQLGRDRSPYIDSTKLPAELRVDYVRYYELDTKTDLIPEPKDFQQFGRKRYRLRKTVIDEGTVFDNPEEYRLTIKKGKAVIAGNRHWAVSTMMQLTDDKGRVPDVEIHDWPSCDYRGIALHENFSPSVDYLKDWLLLIGCYKLNHVHWTWDEEFTEEDRQEIEAYAKECGITLLNDRPVNLKEVVARSADEKGIPTVNRVFLQDATAEGGMLVLDLDGMKKAEALEAIMAFSERFWRGGNAGEGVENFQPDLLSPAGSRLANFKEKVAVRRKSQ